MWILLLYRPGMVAGPPRKPVLQILIHTHFRCDYDFMMIHMHLNAWVTQWCKPVLPLNGPSSTTYAFLSTSQKVAMKKKYDTYSAWIMYDPPKGLGCVSFCKITTSPLLNEITPQVWVDGLFVQICHSTLQQKPVPRWPAAENRGVLSVSGSTVSPQADVSGCNFIKLRGIYLSHNVNNDVEQWQEEMNSPAPQHIHRI